MVDEIAPSAGASKSEPGSAPSPSAPAPVQESAALEIEKLWEDAAASPAEEPSEDQGEKPEEAPAEEPGEAVEEKPAETEEPEEAKPGEEGKGKEQKEPTKEQLEAEQPVVAPVEAPYIKEAMEALKGKPKLAQSIKNLYYRDAGFREQFQTPGEARAFREVVGTLDEAKELRTKGEQLDNFDYGWANDRPGLIRGLHKNSRRELLGFLAESPHVLASLTDENGEPDLVPFKTLTSTAFRVVLENMRAKFADNQDLLEAIEMIEQAGGVKAREAADEKAILQNPQVQALMRENEQHRREQEKGQAEKVVSFAGSVDEGFRNSAVDEITKALTPIFSKGAYTSGAKQAIVGEIMDYVEEKMAPWARSNLDRHVRSGKLDKAHLENVVKAYLDKARPLLRSTEVKEILTRWTQDILGSNRREISRRSEIASRRDVGAGGHTGSGPGGQSAANKPFDQMTAAERADYYRRHPTTDSIWKDAKDAAS